MVHSAHLERYVAGLLETLKLDLTDVQRALPRIAKNRATMTRLEEAVRFLPTDHLMIRGDARNLAGIPDASVHLVVTSPPY